MDSGFQHAKLPPGRPGERWIICWKLVWVNLYWGWQPGVVKLMVKAAPDQPWLVQVEYLARKMGREQQDLATIVYDPRWIRPLVLPEPPGEPDP